MQVRAIAITKPLIPLAEVPIHANGGLREMTAEELIIYEARVSNPDNQGNTDTAPKLLKFLINKKHWSPFDMVNLTVEVKTSKAIGIQILRHWSIHPQEYSQRYAEVTEVEPIELRKKAGKNRQGSDGEPFDPIITVQGVTALASWHVDAHVSIGQELYRALIDAEVAPECARMITPMASTTTMYLNGTVRSWIFYLQQRLSEHAQKEHKIVAKEIEKIFKQYFPNTAEALGL